MNIASGRDRRKTNPRLRMLVVALYVLVASTGALTQQATTPALREGLIVDPLQGVAYVMTPEGGIASVDLATGAIRWTSREAAKPLTLAGSVIVGQAEARTPGNRLELVTLNARQDGRAVRRGRTDLPPGVRPSIGESLHGTFSTAARPTNGAVVVTWSFVPMPLRGMEGQEDQPQTDAQARRPAIPRTEGAVRMNLTTGATSRMDVRAVGAAPPPPRRWSVPAASKIAGASAAQYESADGRHVLATEKVGDDRVWEKYRWTVYERATGRQIGEMRTHVSFAPFVVRELVLAYETTPYAREGKEESAKLRGINLQTGKEIWSVPVREVVWRGTLPP